jgi:hypothetical protein
LWAGTEPVVCNIERIIAFQAIVKIREIGPELDKGNFPSVKRWLNRPWCGGNGLFAVAHEEHRVKLGVGDCLRDTRSQPRRWRFKEKFDPAQLASASAAKRAQSITRPLSSIQSPVPGGWCCVPISRCRALTPSHAHNVPPREDVVPRTHTFDSIQSQLRIWGGGCWTGEQRIRGHRGTDVKVTGSMPSNQRLTTCRVTFPRCDGTKNDKLVVGPHKLVQGPRQFSQWSWDWL